MPTFKIRYGGSYMPWLSAVVSVLGVRIASSGAAFLGNILVARHLEPVRFSHFYLLFTIMTIVAGLTGPGFDTSLVRFASKKMRTDKNASFTYFSVMFYVKCAVFLLTIVAGWALAAPLLKLFVDTKEAAGVSQWAVLLAFFGGAAVSMWSFAQAYFQSCQRFNLYAGLECASSTLRLALVVVLIYLNEGRAFVYLLAYAGAPAIMWIVSWVVLPGRVFTTPPSLSVTREMIAFAKWVLLATLFTTLTQRLDVFLLNAFKVSGDVVGRYSAAVSLALLGELVLLTFYNVLLPKASALNHPGELRAFIGSFRIPSMVFCLLMGLLIPLAEPLRILFFGDKYMGTELYFIVILIGIIVSLGCAPAVTSLYSLGRSHLIAAFEGGRFVATLLLGIYVVPRYGALGMAWVMAGTRACMSAVMYVVAHQDVKRLSMEAWRRGEDFYPHEDLGA